MRQGIIEMRHSKIAIHYMKTWLFFDIVVVGCDLFISLLQEAQESAVSDGDVGYVRLGKSLRFLRTLRLLRLLKVQGMLSEVIKQIQSEASLILLGIMKLIIFILLVNHVIACIWFWIGSMPNQVNGWVAYNELDSTYNDDLAYKYLTSLHWSMTQFTPASMEVTPKNAVERFYNVVTLLFAMITFSSFVSSITNAMTQLRNLNSADAEQQAVLRKLFTEQSVSVALVSRCHAVLSNRKDRAKRRTHLKDARLLDILPASLRLDIQEEVYAKILIEHPFFWSIHTFQPKLLRKIYNNNSVLEEKSLSAGAEVFNIGEQADRMSFVVVGTLSYVFPGDLQLKSMGTSMSLACSSWGSTNSLDSEPASPGGRTADGSVTARVTAGSWICEQALWIDWEYRGTLCTTSSVELLGIKAAAFQSLVLADVGEAVQTQRYAKAYVKHINDFKVEHRDDWIDMDIVRELAHDAFNSSLDDLHPLSGQISPGPCSPQWTPTPTTPTSNAFNFSQETNNGITLIDDAPQPPGSLPLQTDPSE